MGSFYGGSFCDNFQYGYFVFNFLNMTSQKCMKCGSDMELEQVESGNPHPDNAAIQRESVWMCTGYDCAYFEEIS